MIRGGQVTLFVRDVSRALRFYVETLGMKLVEQTSGWALIDAGEGFQIGLRESPDAKPSTAHIGLTPKVPLREAIAIYENRGVSFDVRTENGVETAHFVDDDANALSLIAPRE